MTWEHISKPLSRVLEKASEGSMSTKHLNGMKTETVIDNRPGNLDLDQIENQIRFAKDLQLSKLALHLCHLETLVKYAREYLNQPKEDWRRTVGS